MAFTNQQLLHVLEKGFNQREILKSDYFRKKKRIIHDAFLKNELLEPSTNFDRNSPIQDSQNNEFCYIPPGPFIYGENNEMNESHSGIYLAKFPVTLSQFASFIKDSNWEYPESDFNLMMERSSDPNCPVYNISWLDAKEYCRWLRNYTNEYYSLPYEDEWEYAARGIDGRQYPWGHHFPNPDLANSREISRSSGTVEIGYFKDNYSPFGLWEMIGNISEWCLDEFESSKDLRILRGGSSFPFPEDAKCTYRKSCHAPGKRIVDAGFRLLYLPGDLFGEYKSQIRSSKSQILDRIGLRKI